MLKRRSVERALVKKGFRKIEDSRHIKFIYYTKSGIKSKVCTIISHGSKSIDIDDNLASVMADQCCIRLKEFKESC